MHLESRLGGVSLDAWVGKGSGLTFDLSLVWCGVGDLMLGVFVNTSH
jgi:hypothetical protein